MTPLRRLRTAAIAFVVVVMVGTVGYLTLGFGALYQTVTTIRTVGFREVRPLSPVGHREPDGQFLTKPAAETVLAPGQILIAIRTAEELGHLATVATSR